MIIKNQIFKQVIFLTLLMFSSGIVSGQKKNVLLIISDDLNTRIGPYMDLKDHTPNLDRLAEEGVSFTRTYCQYPLCGPSRASIMSGLYPQSNGVLGNSMRKGSYRTANSGLSDHPSLAGFFRENGYFTARVSKIFHMGVPGGIERGEAGDDDPDSWDFASNIMGPETLSSGYLELLSPADKHYGSSFARMKLDNNLAETQTDYIATSQAIAILESRAAEVAPNATNKIKTKPQSPFFLAVGLVRPHVPFIAPENCFEPYPEEKMEIPNYVVKENVPRDALRKQNKNKAQMNELQKQKTIGAYMASVRFMDQQVGRLLETLDRLDLREETIVVFLSDHGYNLGEHDCWAKGSLWEGTLRVPLIISVPGHEEGSECSDISELIDLYPTLADLCNLSDDQPDILQGTSLAKQAKGKFKKAAQKVAYSVSYQGDFGSIKTNRWRYTRWGNDANTINEELYDHGNDPEEHYNLVNSRKKMKWLKKMRNQYDKAKENAGSFVGN
jgi:arylsulfatase A-like enzyme